MQYAPSRYQFRSDLEFETAMNEWLAENEPSYIVTRFNYDTLEWEQHHFNFLFEAMADFRQGQKESREHQDVRKPAIETHYPSAWGNIPMRYSRPGESKNSGQYGGNPDHLPGGSQNDYRMAGYNRY